MARITHAGERLIAQKVGELQPLEVSRFVLALVPDLDPNQPVNRDEQLPPANQIVYDAPPSQSGYVNPNQVVYSLMMGSDVGDFDWNWIGLETVDQVLLAVAYVPLQQKRKNIPPLQLGNNVTRNFMVVFDGAQALTGLTIDASTWQHDFTVRLAGIDERERLSNRDIFGRSTFLEDGFQLATVNGGLMLQPGLAYIEGVRIEAVENQPAVPPGLPNTAWLDVALVRDRSDVVATWSVAWGEDLQDNEDSAGAWHYRVPLARLDAGGLPTDLRTIEPVTGPLVRHFAARVGTYPDLRAQATTKEDVGLSNIPNAISDDPALNHDDVLATTAATHAALQRAADDLQALDESLGSAARRDVGSEPGNVLEVGAFGLGAEAINISQGDANTLNRTGYYMGKELHNAPDSGWWYIEHIEHGGGNGGWCRQFWSSFEGNRLMTRSKRDGTWSKFFLLFHSGNLNPETIVPPGAVMSFAMPSPPTGYLKANGSAISRTNYADLFAAIGTRYGGGDGSTTFNLPDLRGLFPRAWDDGRGIDGGRGFGSFQDSMVLSHHHTAWAEGNGAHGHNAWTDAQGNHQHESPFGERYPQHARYGAIGGPNNFGVGASDMDNHIFLTSWAGQHAHNVGIAVDGFHGHIIHVNGNGGHESRPKNLALLFCIKY